MTVCIAAACERAQKIVIAVDRMLTIPVLSLEFEHPGSKIVHLSNSCVMMTAGSALRDIELQKDVRRALGGLSGVPVETIIERVKDRYQQARRKKIEDQYLKPRGLTLESFLQTGRNLIPDVAMVIDEQLATYSYGVDVLVAGVDSEGAHIYEIDNPGTAECFDSIGYHAIGSGESHAAFSLIEEDYSSYSATLQEAMWEVFQAKKRAEKAPGVGQKGDFAVIEQGRIFPFAASTLAVLEDLYKEAAATKEECSQRLKPKFASIPLPEEKQ